MAVVPLGFKVGDLVRWTSAVGGVWRHHVGVIVAEVPAGEFPYKFVPAGRWSIRYRDARLRTSVSYLVARKDGPGLYRPHVGHLRHYQAGDAPMVVKPARARRTRAQASLPVVWRAPVAPAWRRPALVAARAVAALLFVLLVAGVRDLP